MLPKRPTRRSRPMRDIVHCILRRLPWWKTQRSDPRRRSSPTKTGGAWCARAGVDDVSGRPLSRWTHRRTARERPCERRPRRNCARRLATLTPAATTPVRYGDSTRHWRRLDTIRVAAASQRKIQLGARKWPPRANAGEAQPLPNRDPTFRGTATRAASWADRRVLENLRDERPDGGVLSFHRARIRRRAYWSASVQGGTTL